MTYREYLAKPASFQIQWNRAVQVITQMRAHGYSLQKAAKEIGISPAIVVRLAGSALRRTLSGRIVAKPADQLLRVLLIPGDKGLREVPIRDSRQASLIGEYWNAVEKYLTTGDSRMLLKGRWKNLIDARGNRVQLLTDLTILRRQASAGVLQFESLYGRRS